MIPRRTALIARRPDSADAFAAWAKGHPRRLPQAQTEKPKAATPSTASTPSMKFTKSTYAEIAANGAFALTAVAAKLLDRQLESQAAAFERNGGFTERLYRVRTQRQNETNAECDAKPAPRRGPSRYERRDTSDGL